MTRTIVLALLAVTVCLSNGVAQASRPTNPGWLGVFFDDATSARVVEVVPGSPAADASLRAGDVLTSIGEAPTPSVDAAIEALGRHAVGSVIDIGYRRGELDATVSVTLARRPIDPHERAPALRRTGAKPSGGKSGRKPSAPAVEQDLASRPESPYERALAVARTRGVPLLLAFHAEWCAQCKTQREAFRDEAVAWARRGVELLWVDTGRDPGLADRFSVANVPHLVAVDHEGRSLATSSGYLPAAKLRGWLERLPKPAGPAPRSARRDVVGDARRDREVEALRRELRDLKREVERLRGEIRSLQAEVRRVRTRR